MSTPNRVQHGHLYHRCPALTSTGKEFAIQGPKLPPTARKPPSRQKIQGMSSGRARNPYGQPRASSSHAPATPFLPTPNNWPKAGRNVIAVHLRMLATRPKLLSLLSWRSSLQNGNISISAIIYCLILDAFEIKVADDNLLLYFDRTLSPIKDGTRRQPVKLKTYADLDQ